MTAAYFDLLDSVNNAMTLQDPKKFEDFLDKRRGSLLKTGGYWSPINDDLHTMAKFGEDRSMCC
jgi:hypothetical protein